MINFDNSRRMQKNIDAYLGNKENEKLLRVFLLKNSYEVAKSLQKQVVNSLASSCVIIRRNKIKNQTEFGYKQELKTGVLKKIHFVYLSNISDLITFLWAHFSLEKAMTAGIFIDSIDQYFGEKFSFVENGRNIMIVMNLLGLLNEKVLGKKNRIKTGFSFSYNSYVFPRADFMNFMANSGITYWQVTGREVTKNGEEFESEWSKKFLATYGVTAVKQVDELENL